MILRFQFPDFNVEYFTLDSRNQLNIYDLNCEKNGRATMMVKMKEFSTSNIRLHNEITNSIKALRHE